MSDRITVDDLDAKLREIGGTVQTTASDVKGVVLGGVGVAVAVALLAVYALGRRRGRRDAPVLEIRRI